MLAVNMFARIVQTIALGRLLRWFEEEPAADSDGMGNSGFLWASLLIICGMVSFPTKQQQYFETYRVG